MGISQFDLLPVFCQNSLVKGWSKGKSRNTVICKLKQTNLIVHGGTRFASPRNVFPRLNSVCIHVSGYTTSARSVLPFITAVAQKGFLVLANKFFALNAQSYHFSCSSNERMTN